MRSISAKKKKKCCIGYKDAKKIKPLCVFYQKCLRMENILMKLKTYRFLIRDDKFLENYIETWDKVSYTIGKEIDSNPVYNKI